MTEILTYVLLGVLALYLVGWVIWRLTRKRTAVPTDGGLQEVSRSHSGKLTIPDALATFSAVTLLVGVAGGFVQLWLGLWGLVVTEALILLGALLTAKLSRGSWREIFSLRMPTLRKVLGGLSLWAGSLVGASVLNLLMLQWFPSYSNTVDYLNNFMLGGNLPLAILAIGILPAVCEEALHRGVILSAFRGKLGTVGTVLCMGAIFGLFHLDPFRFPATALLGMALTYAGIASGSIAVPMLMHFMNNLLSVLTLYLASGGTSVGQTGTLFATTTPQGLIGAIAWVVYLSVISFALLFVGLLLLQDKGRKPPRRALATLGAALGLLAVIGGVTSAVSYSSSADAATDGFNTTFTFGDMTGNQDMPVKFTRDGTLHVTLDATCEDGNYTFTLKSPSGETVLQYEGREISEDVKVPVTAGVWHYAYTVEGSSGSERAVNGSFSLKGILE